jgi:hypothetical protein
MVASLGLLRINKWVVRAAAFAFIYLLFIMAVGACNTLFTLCLAPTVLPVLMYVYSFFVYRPGMQIYSLKS